MIDRNEIYRKFGETSEAAQLLETELGSLVFEAFISTQDSIEEIDQAEAAEYLANINKATLGQLIKRVNAGTSHPLDEELLRRALDERNRLAHHFFREHNWRINSNDGRIRMHEDLCRIHDTILNAYRMTMMVSGIDIDELARQGSELPKGHLPI